MKRFRLLAAATLLATLGCAGSALAQTTEDAGLREEYKEAKVTSDFRSIFIRHTVRLASRGVQQTSDLVLIGLAACKTPGFHDVGRSFFDAAIRRLGVSALTESIELSKSDCAPDQAAPNPNAPDPGPGCVACVGMIVDRAELLREMASLKSNLFSPGEGGDPTKNQEFYAEFERLEQTSLALAEFRDDVASIETLGLDPADPEWRRNLLALKAVDAFPMGRRLIELQAALPDTVSMPKSIGSEINRLDVNRFEDEPG